MQSFCLSSISIYGADGGDFLTEDFWFTVAIARSEDEVGIDEFERARRTGGAGYPVQDVQVVFG